MARGRMIDQRFTQSHKLQSLSRDHRLVYASILPYLDRAGRAIAEPMVLKVNVFRKTDFTIEEITAAVAEFQRVGLIRLYADKDNDAILEYTDFSTFNTPNSRERQSDFGGPDDPTSTAPRDPDLLAAMGAHVQPQAERASTAQDATPAPHVQLTCERRETPREGSAGPHAGPPRERKRNVNGNENVQRLTEPPPTPPRQPLTESTPEEGGGIDGLRGTQTALQRLGRTDKRAAIELERVARAAGWKYAQKLEAAQAALDDPPAALAALARTFDLLEGLKFPYAFFKKLLTTPEVAAVPLPPRDSSSFAAMIAAAKEGDLDALTRLTA